jgi:hypothetical protein
VRINKYEYLFVIQGNCGYGWNDECFEENFADAKRTIKDYRDNCNWPFRIICRRVLNPSYSAS